MYDEIRATDLETWLADSAQIVDVREEWEFGNGHLPGAVNIPLGSLTEHLDQLREPVVLVCATDHRSAMAATYLTSQVKLSRVAILLGGTVGWVRIGNPLEFPAERSAAGAPDRT